MTGLLLRILSLARERTLAAVLDLPDEFMALQPAGARNHPAWTLGHLLFVEGKGARVLGLSPSSPAEEKRYTVLFGRGLAAGFAAAMVILTAWWFGASHNPCDQVKDARFAELVKTSQGEGDEADEAQATCKQILGWIKEGKDPAAELKKQEAEEQQEQKEEEKPE